MSLILQAILLAVSILPRRRSRFLLFNRALTKGVTKSYSHWKARSGLSSSNFFR